MRRQIVSQVGGPIDRDRGVVGEPDRFQSIQIAEEARRAPRAELQRRRNGEIGGFHTVEAGQARLIVNRIDHVTASGDAVVRRVGIAEIVEASCRGTQAARAAGGPAISSPWPQSRFESARMWRPPSGPPARILKYVSS